MSTSQTSQKKSFYKYIFLIFLLLIVIFLFKACDPVEKSNQMMGSAEKTEQVENSSRTQKHGQFSFQSGIGAKSTGEFWFDEDMYRITWYKEDGSPRLHMISPDGENTYFANVAEGTTTLSYLSPEMHNAIFMEPDGFKSKEESEEDGLQVSKYIYDKLWQIEGADQQFYLKDLEVYSKNGQVKKVITRTASSHPESDDKLVTSTYTFSNIEYLESIDQSLFEFPFPME